MTKAVNYMGLNILLDDDDDLLQPEDQAVLIAILQKSEIVEYQISPNDDGSYSYEFKYRLPKVDAVKVKAGS